MSKRENGILGEVLGNAGFVVEFFTAIAQAVIAFGGNIEEMRAVKNNPERIKAIARLIVPVTEKVEEVIQKITTTVSDAFITTVSYIAPTFEVLETHFIGYLNPDFREAQFEPIERLKGVVFENGVVDFVLVHLGRSTSTNDVLSELDRLGYRPATFWELIAFALVHPDEQLKYPVVALGSVARLYGYRNVAYLYRYGDGRALNLRWVDNDWGDDCRFLAVRK